MESTKCLQALVSAPANFPAGLPCACRGALSSPHAIRHETVLGRTRALRGAEAVLVRASDPALIRTADQSVRIPMIVFSNERNAEAGAILKPVPNDYLRRWPVSKRVNSSKADADDPTLIERVDLAVV